MCPSKVMISEKMITEQIFELGAANYTKAKHYF